MINTPMHIDTQEYQQRLEDLQHGLISTEEWLRYCATIRASITIPHVEEVDANDAPESGNPL